MITSAELTTKTWMAPLVPTGTTAAFATAWPLYPFSVDTSGKIVPVGHIDTYARNPAGSTVRFREYAPAAAGSPQGPCASGKVRVSRLAGIGPNVAGAAFGSPLPATVVI